MLEITLIAALSDDGFISCGKGVPWDLPADKAYFRAYTAGKHLLIGRTTYQEMLGWFRDHTPLVLTRDAQFVPAIGHRVGNVEEACEIATQAGVKELVVCGGAQTYSAAMPFATRLLLTQVHAQLGSGAAFPTIDPAHWREASRRHHAADGEHAYAMTFLRLERVGKTPCEA